MVDELGEVIAGQRPLLDYEAFLSRYGRDFINYRLTWNEPTDFSPRGVDTIVRRYKERERFIGTFGFAIPCREAIAAVAGAGPVVEIGAGTGSWSKLVALAGGDIVATDPCIRGYLGFEHGKYFPLERLAGKTAVRRYRDRNVLCAWPSLDETWFRQALKAMRIGRRIFYVEESATAEESALTYLEDFFVEEGAINIPCFHGLHDRLVIYRKVKQGPWRERQAEMQRAAAERYASFAAWREEARERDDRRGTEDPGEARDREDQAAAPAAWGA